MILLRRPRGWAIPLDTIAVKPRRYARTLPAAGRAPFAALRPGRAIISRTEAGLRDAGVGAVLDLAGGRSVRVAAVVDDALLRWAEVAIPAGDPRMPPLRTTVIAALRSPVTRGQLARWTERGAATRLLPGPGDIGPARPAGLKVQFGEPAVGLPYGNDWIRLSPAFVHRYIVSRRVPILGTVTCHRAMVPHLRAALARAAPAAASPASSTRATSPAATRHGGSSRAASSPSTPGAWRSTSTPPATRSAAQSHQDPRLVRVMEKHGFTWGGRWPTRPDPMHFELRGSDPLSSQPGKGV